MNLGVVGLGNMGYPMALNLVKAGHGLTVYNRSSEAVQKIFDTGFAIDLMAKDLRLARDLGKGLGTELPMAERALSIFEKAAQAGMGRRDVSAALQLYEE